VFELGRHPSIDDLFVLVGPNGDVVWQYRKTELPPGEGDLLVPSDGVLPVAQTAYGRIGGAVAFDMDFPGLLLQAGRNQTDMLVVPENESGSFDPMHSRMALYRAVENGFNLVLHASQSLSLVCDYHGRIYALMDHYHAGDRVLVGQLPTKGTTTIYALGGWLFPQLCLVALGVLLVATLVTRRRPTFWAR
jgi:apolipoprotein N-acyltransferase